MLVEFKTRPAKRSIEVALVGRISVFVEVMAKTALIDRYGPYLGVKQGRFVLKVQGEIKWEKLQ